MIALTGLHYRVRICKK